MPRLTLTRKEGERIFIRTKSGELIIIGVSEIDRNKVKIVTEAEADVAIWREELSNERQANYGRTLAGRTEANSVLATRGSSVHEGGAIKT